MITAYGDRARAFAQRLGDLEAIVTDADNVGHAYREAVRRREAGESFYGLTLIDDRRVAFGYAYGNQILAQASDYDVRRAVAQRLTAGELPINGQRVDTIWGPNAGFEAVTVEFLWLCDALLVRSFAEYERLAAMFARHPNPRPLHPVERILTAGNVPVVERERPERPGIVVWAPGRAAVECALALHGLAEVHGDIVCVSAGGPPPAWPGNARLLTAGDPAVRDALARSSAVVCIDPSDPADAVAFARAGFGVVAPFSSGAHEFASDIVPWDALDAAFLFTAAAIAIARPAFVHTEAPRPPRAPVAAPRPAFADSDGLPLVTIITPTYNRREQLREMLTCVAAQTYPNIESVVVNDGGVAVDDIVAAFPFARLIDKPQNAGTARAQLTGWEHARGEYIGLLPDDDWLYPDHIERLLNAMLRSGAKLAHGAGLLRFLERLDTGAWFTVGYNASVFAQTLAESDALVSSTVAGHQMLVHRSLYEEFGWYDLDSDVSDNEMHARFTQRYFYAFPDHVTCEFREHAGSQGRTCDFPAAMHHMYTAIHPVQNRPILENIRRQTIAHVARRPAGEPAFPRTLRIER
jgi:hypothetical protein